MKYGVYLILYKYFSIW